MSNIASSGLEHNLESFQSSIKTRNYASLAALVILVWEYLITCKHEYLYIWSAILGQMYGTPFSAVSVSSSTCRNWFIFLLVSGWLMLATVNVILMLRGISTYSKKIAFLLLLLMLIELCLAVTCHLFTFKYVTFNAICDAQETPIQALYFCCSVVITQTVVWSLTLVKRKLNLGQIPVLRRVLQDGAWAWILICSFHLLFGVVTLIMKRMIAVCPYRSSQLLILRKACRLIMNLQRLKFGAVDDEDQELTTNIVVETSIAEDDCRE
ncbi:hypothetical protein BDQ12DRAFT_771250 [Crucibulum laeve]|uniref:DUF6533 domain-containing protein n=1 Tax=Crucibulum laeve TaxID=68775 RepID=A0A5C3LJZ4_9AGAR|nr:hypothetical protein BDQ12DRAFT_771250 [Crucibulum laeve]